MIGEYVQAICNVFNISSGTLDILTFSVKSRFIFMSSNSRAYRKVIHVVEAEISYLLLNVIICKLATQFKACCF